MNPSAVSASTSTTTPVTTSSSNSNSNNNSVDCSPVVEGTAVVASDTTTTKKCICKRSSSTSVIPDIISTTEDDTIVGITSTTEPLKNDSTISTTSSSPSSSSSSINTTFLRKRNSSHNLSLLQNEQYVSVDSEDKHYYLMTTKSKNDYDDTVIVVDPNGGKKSRSNSPERTNTVSNPITNEETVVEVHKTVDVTSTIVPALTTTKKTSSLPIPTKQHSVETKSKAIVSLSKSNKTNITIHHQQKQQQQIQISHYVQPRLILPSPDCGNDMDPDTFLLEILSALYPNIKLEVKNVKYLESVQQQQESSSSKAKPYFSPITEEQMIHYNTEIVQIVRTNNVTALQEYYQKHGRVALNCYNRFGEGLLNMACRRGFTDIVKFMLSNDIALNVRIRDDTGRTPLHDACWYPEPQITICTWIIQKDPSLLLVADSRGYTPFQYARKSDWPIWRKFLVNNLDQIRLLGSDPEIVANFSTSSS